MAENKEIGRGGEVCAQGIHAKNCHLLPCRRFCEWEHEKKEAATIMVEEARAEMGRVIEALRNENEELREELKTNENTQNDLEEARLIIGNKEAEIETLSNTVSQISKEKENSTVTQMKKKFKEAKLAAGKQLRTMEGSKKELEEALATEKLKVVSLEKEKKGAEEKLEKEIEETKIWNKEKENLLRSQQEGVRLQEQMKVLEVKAVAQLASSTGREERSDQSENRHQQATQTTQTGSSQVKRRLSEKRTNTNEMESQLCLLKMALKMIQCGIKDIKMNQNVSPTVVNALTLVETFAETTKHSLKSNETLKKKLKIEKQEYFEYNEESKTKIDDPKELTSIHKNVESETDDDEEYIDFGV